MLNPYGRIDTIIPLNQIHLRVRSEKVREREIERERDREREREIMRRVEIKDRMDKDKAERRNLKLREEKQTKKCN